MTDTHDPNALPAGGEDWEDDEHWEAHHPPRSAHDPIFDRPIHAAAPPDLDEEGRRLIEAQKQRRLTQIHDDTRGPIEKQVKRVTRAYWHARGLAGQAEVTKHAAYGAAREHARVDGLVPLPLGDRYDPFTRTMSTTALFIILLVTVLSAYLADRGAFLVFGLPAAATEVLAIITSAIQAFTAHSLGTQMKRRHENIDPEAADPERWFRRLEVVGLLLAAVGLSAVRAVAGDLLLALIILVVVVCSSVVATWAAYAHHNPRRKAIDRTSAVAEKQSRRAVRDVTKAKTAEASTETAVQELMDLCAAAVGRVDAVLTAYGTRPGETEAPWIARWRRWAQGRDLPIPHEVARGTGGLPGISTESAH